MDIARTTPIERVDRVPAPHALSRNAEGDNPSGGGDRDGEHALQCPVLGSSREARPVPY